MHDFSYILMLGTVLGKLLIAAILGGTIGWERHRRGRPAGLRTHLLVCIGVTLMMLVSEHIFVQYQSHGHNSILRVDPARIAAQVVTGIGFLGAGTIMRSKASIRGLTTAASLWVVAGIGLAVGSGFIVPAIFTTVIAIAILTLNSLVERKMKRNRYRSIKMSITSQEHFLDDISHILEKHSVKLKNYKFKKNIEKDEIEYDLDVMYRDEKKLLLASNDVTKTIKEIKSFSLE
ncbi:MAG: MgtC/SapB family protein [Candidatus Scalindua sp.]|nr:MgtC/SapB family protein [Candidatus Scalindua sp.]